MRIALYRGKSIVSSLIRWFTRSEYSHAELWFPLTAISAEQTGVVRKPLPRQRPTGTAVDLFELSPPISAFMASKAFEEAQSLVGKRYDFGAVFGRFPLRLPGDNRDKWFCSEIVSEVCDRIGRPLFARTRAHQVTPDMVSRSPMLRWVETVCV